MEPLLDQSSEVSLRKPLSSFGDVEIQLKQYCLQAMSGDQEQYVRFLELTADLLRRYLGKLSRGRSSKGEFVEDLVQEVLISIHEKLGTYRRDLPIIPWIFGIARYRLIDFLRSESRTKTGERIEREIRDLFHQPVELAEDSLARSQELEILMRPLSSHQKDVLLLAKVHELSLCEIGKVYGMTVGAVKVTIHRALSKVRAAGGIEENED